MPHFVAVDPAHGAGRGLVRMHRLSLPQQLFHQVHDTAGFHQGGSFRPHPDDPAQGDPDPQPDGDGLYRPSVTVAALMHTNVTQEMADDVFGASSRRYSALGPISARSPQYRPRRMPSPHARPWAAAPPCRALSAPPGTGTRSRICSPASPATRAVT